MEKIIYDKKTGIHYELQGDYYLPCLKLPEQPKVEIGIWGKRHLRYIKQHHKIRYTNLLTSCKLTAYLADIDEQAEDMFFRLVKQLAEKEGVTEQLKADNQMEWVARMNNIAKLGLVCAFTFDTVRRSCVIALAGKYCA